MHLLGHYVFLHGAQVFSWSEMMNWDKIEGQWKTMKGKVKEKWGELTDDEVTQINGQRDQLAGTLQKRYGIAKDEAERQITEFESACGV